jgi:hypothetical protein
MPHVAHRGRITGNSSPILLGKSCRSLSVCLRTAEFSSGQLVEKEINGGNPAVPGNDEIGPRVGWCLTRAA